MLKRGTLVAGVVVGVFCHGSAALARSPSGASCDALEAQAGITRAGELAKLKVRASNAAEKTRDADFRKDVAEDLGPGSEVDQLFRAMSPDYKSMLDAARALNDDKTPETTAAKDANPEALVMGKVAMTDPQDAQKIEGSLFAASSPATPARSLPAFPIADPNAETEGSWVLPNGAPIPGAGLVFENGQLRGRENSVVRSINSDGTESARLVTITYDPVANVLSKPQESALSWKAAGAPDGARLDSSRPTPASQKISEEAAKVVSCKAGASRKTVASASTGPHPFCSTLHFLNVITGGKGDNDCGIDIKTLKANSTVSDAGKEAASRWNKGDLHDYLKVHYGMTTVTLHQKKKDKVKSIDQASKKELLQVIYAQNIDVTKLPPTDGSGTADASEQ